MAFCRPGRTRRDAHPVPRPWRRPNEFPFFAHRPCTGRAAPGCLLSFEPALAQSTPATPAPAASANPAPAPSASPAPAASASPAPAASATPAPAASASPAPSSPPTAAQPPAASVQTADPFGESITLEAKKVLIAKGTANWDNAFDTLIDSF